MVGKLGGLSIFQDVWIDTCQHLGQEKQIWQTTNRDFSHRGSAFCCSINAVYGSLAPEVCVRSHESSWQCNHADGVAAVPALSTPLQLGSEPQPWEQLGRGYRHNVSRRRWLGAACGEGKAPPACQHGCLVTGFSAGAQRCSGSVVQDHLFKVQ